MSLYEHRAQPPISRRLFLRRLTQHGVLAGSLVAGSALLGSIGYHVFAGYSWIDSFLNACMLLGGMGPMGELSTTSGKLFASFFALYAGLVFLGVAAIVLAPVFHRVLHRFHWEVTRQ